jgi:hypothetical protein
MYQWLALQASVERLAGPKTEPNEAEHKLKAVWLKQDWHRGRLRDIPVPWKCAHLEERVSFCQSMYER